jgi:sporulation and cell division protein SsgA
MNGQPPDRPPSRRKPERARLRRPTSDGVIADGPPNTQTPAPPQVAAGEYLITQMLVLSDGDLPLVHAEFHYRCIDPFVVQLRLSVDRCRAVEWVFSRDLLIAGIRHRSGVGDVRVYPGGDGLLIELRSGTDGHAVLLADRPPIEQFLYRTVSIVPIGSEIKHYNIDADLIRLGTGRYPPHWRQRGGPSL